MSTPAIIVDNVSKKFARSLKRGMVYGLTDMAAMALIPRHWRSGNVEARMADADRELREGNVSDSVSDASELIANPVSDAELRPSEFWALRNISFEVEQGETLALLGANGAGKSTMFSVLSGIYAPTHGSVSYRGRLQALIALGAGFHPALSGRENLYINAAILGMKEKEVAKIYDSILDFAGIGSFIDSPIRNYSSGMVVRLAFSIAIHLDPDVLLIDEVLAVGDAHFQMKCAKYTRDLANSGKTIVVVSHNMLIVQMMCQRAIWLDKGSIRQQGETHEVSRDYQKFMLAKGTAKDIKTAVSSKTMPAAILEAQWLDLGGSPVTNLERGKKYKLCFEVEAREDIDCARMWASISTVSGESRIVGVNMFDDGHMMKLKKGVHRVTVIWDQLPLGQNHTFQITAGLRDWSGHVILSDSFASRTFEMEQHGVLCTLPSSRNSTAPSQNPLIPVPYVWEASGDVTLTEVGEEK